MQIFVIMPRQRYFLSVVAVAIVVGWHHHLLHLVHDDSWALAVVVAAAVVVSVVESVEETRLQEKTAEVQSSADLKPVDSIVATAAVVVVEIGDFSFAKVLPEQQQQQPLPLLEYYCHLN